MKNIFKSIWNTVNSTYLCLRFPFLYPRNHFTDRHYSNWRLDDKIQVVFYDSHTSIKRDKYDFFHPRYRIRKPLKALWSRILRLYRSLLELLHCVPTYCWLDRMDAGWRRAFGLDMCKEIKTVLKRQNFLRKYRITDIKEKFGALRWYGNYASEEIIDIIRKYEGKSYRTCIECGRKAKYRSTGWIEPYCENCLPDFVRDKGFYEKYLDERWELMPMCEAEITDGFGGTLTD